MKYLLGMQILQSKHDLQCKSPYCFFIYRFSHLSLQELRKIASTAVFHTDVELFLFDEGVKILHNIWGLYILHYLCFIQCLYQCMYTHSFIFLSIFFIYTSFKTHTYPLSFLRTLNTTPKDPLPNLVMISNYFKLINIIMNEYKLQKAKEREEIADRFICSILKRIGWSVKVPYAVRSIIMAFLYRSFFAHPAMYTLISKSNIQNVCEDEKPLWIQDKCEYIVENESQMLQLKVFCWRKIQENANRYYLDMLKQFFQPIFLNSSQKKVVYQGSQLDEQDFFRTIKCFNLKNNRITKTISDLMKKNILLLEQSHTIYCLVGNVENISSFNRKVSLRFYAQVEKWGFSSNICLWKKGFTPSRKRHWIRFTKLEIFEIEGPFINKLERLPQKEQAKISYQVL